MLKIYTDWVLYNWQVYKCIDKNFHSFCYDAELYFLFFNSKGKYVHKTSENYLNAALYVIS